jgi:hypothetical protein
VKLIVELPDTTICAFVNYLHYEGTEMMMRVKSISSDEVEQQRSDNNA